MNKIITNFKYGVINNIEAQSIPDGAASSSLNFLTKGDKIEFRRGSDIKGTEIAGSGSVTGLHTAYKVDGTEVIYRKRGRKLEYFDTVTDDWAEVGTDIFPLAAVNDEATFANYQSLAGAELFISSPNGGILKIMVANPASYSTLHTTTGDFRGRIKIKWNRMFLWGLNRDKTGLYLSHIDDTAGTATTVTGEATGSLGGTLAFRAGGATRTCYGVAITITATSELYTDNYNGVLTGSLGGTGTINYTTGVYTLSNAGVGTADYFWEDSNTNGITDFTYSATRVAGEGAVFRQDDGGALQNVMIYNETIYCVHETNTYALILTNDDTNADNNIYREKVGISSWKGCVDTGKGIYYIDEAVEGKPEFKLLTLDSNSGQVIPQVVSLNIDLTAYTFDENKMFEWYDYIIFTGKTSGATANNRMFVYNKIWQSLDILDYFADNFTTDDGALIAGDSTTYNVWTLFSGSDDQDSDVYGEWISGITRLDLDRLKKVKRFIIEGEIVPNQSFNIYASADRGGWTLIDTIEGTGDYVDSGSSVSVGAVTVGKKEVGGGSTISAYHYQKECRFDIDKFDNIQIKFETVGLGYVAISMYQFYSILPRLKKISKKYRTI